jgi:hypothetical protein
MDYEMSSTGSVESCTLGRPVRDSSLASIDPTSPNPRSIRIALFITQSCHDVQESLANPTMTSAPTIAIVAPSTSLLVGC